MAARTGAANIGMASRFLLPNEKDLYPVMIAKDAIAIIVHPTNPVSNLSLLQVSKIFSGKIRNWKEVGGNSHPIVLVTREEGSGTREAFQKFVMKKEEISLEALVQDSNGAIRQVVSSDPNAIGYISLGLVNDKVKALKISGVEPDHAHIENGKYTLVRPFLFVFNGKPEGEAKAFLEFVLSPGSSETAPEGRPGLCPSEIISIAMEIKEKVIEKIFLLVALSSIAVLGVITLFIFKEGIPLIWKVGFRAFILGERWVPSQGSFGIFPMIVSSFWVTFGALSLGYPPWVSLHHLSLRMDPILSGHRAQACHPSSGGHPFGHLWLLGTCRHRPAGSKLSWRAWPEHTLGLIDLGLYDPTNDHQHLRRLPQGPSAFLQSRGPWPWEQRTGRRSGGC